jgi:phosphotransferase system enzyme I (PtsI)
MLSNIRSTVQSPTGEETRFLGIGVSPGIALGVVFIADDDALELAPMPVADEEIECELERFNQALEKSKEQLAQLGKNTMAGIIGNEIFETHLMMVDDPKMRNEVEGRIRAERLNAGFIYSQVTMGYANVFAEMADPYLRARAQDIRDVSSRVLRNLLGSVSPLFPEAAYKHLLVARDITPSSTISLNCENVLGFATDMGSPTSHTAIISRALGIPAVVGCHDLSSKIKGGDQILLDGHTGVVILNPKPSTVDQFQKIGRKHSKAQRELQKLRGTRSQTKDGKAITLSANIRLSTDIHSVSEHGAEGIGLYRTELLYLNKPILPTEEEQYKIYAEAALGAHPHRVIIRTVDIGGDKVMPALDLAPEANPFLGMRGLRFCLKERAMFRTQLRAILRTSVHRNVGLMFPMVTTMEELREAKAILQECRNELREKGILFDTQMEVGAMIETPAAALISDMIGKEVDFLSIGTNDLIQYTTAIDRQNDELAHLYQPTHPAVIRLLKMVVSGARTNGIWVGVCGEMAGDILLTPLLVGLGIDELSTSPSLVPQVKRAIRSLSSRECQELVRKVENGLTTQEILFESSRLANKRYRDILP